MKGKDPEVCHKITNGKGNGLQIIRVLGTAVKIGKNDMIEVNQDPTVRVGRKEGTESVKEVAQGGVENMKEVIP